MKNHKLIIIALLFSVLFFPVFEADAYIGPGAGFALASSFFFLLVAIVLAFFTIISFPVRALILLIKRRSNKKKAKIKRLLIIGFDGMDPELCQQYFENGKLPHLKQLSQTGSFTSLKTTTPAISPVAWSTFSTGVNPGKHNIFDFFTRNPQNYLPVISSTQISTTRKKLKYSPIPFSVTRTTTKLLRKSTSVWKLLGEKKIFSTVLRVPITFPPEKFYGVCLSAMCVPDLVGTQGRYSHFTSEVNSDGPEGQKTDENREAKGLVIPLKTDGKSFKTSISGPIIRNGEKTLSLSVPVTGEIDATQNLVRLTIKKETIVLKKGEYSPWMKLEFRLGFRKQLSGIVRFLLTSVEPDTKIYMTPINIDPEKPNLPISSPYYYSVALSKIHGPFSTLGLAEDTDALDDEVIDEAGFLTQAYDIYDERKRIFLDNLKKSKEGLLVNVFDTTDRIQHMFFRYLDPDHPANQGKDTTKYRNTIEDLYGRMDDLVGEVQKQIKKDDLLLIVSDHGFKPFKWGVNLNTWLWQEGYLVTKNNLPSKEKWFADIDWQKTRAFAFGLAGIFINTKGRESHGSVVPGSEKRSLLLELKEKLEKLTDPANDQKPIRRIILAVDGLKGPYVNNAPDIIVGYEIGYRSSWDCAVGKIAASVLEDNTRRWSGDHCIDPELVPGVLFTNWKLKDEHPSLTDIAPTILDMFGIKKQKFHDGTALCLSPPE